MESQPDKGPQVERILNKARQHFANNCTPKAPKTPAPPQKRDKVFWGMRTGGLLIRFLQYLVFHEL